MPNPVLRWQILAKNPEACAAFYSQVFDWQISAANQLSYRSVETGAEGGIDGGIWPVAPGEGHPMVQLFVGVADVQAFVDKAVSAGATVIVPRQVLPDGDEMAILLDTEGMPFGIMKQR